MTTEPADCETCGGSCEVEEWDDAGNARMAICPDCGGTGFAQPSGRGAGRVSEAGERVMDARQSISGDAWGRAPAFWPTPMVARGSATQRSLNAAQSHSATSYLDDADHSDEAKEA